MGKIIQTLSELWEMMQEMLPDLLKAWPAPALQHMRLGPQGSQDNALMLQAFTWEAKHEHMSWWRHIENEIPALAELGVTQLWLPPPNKAMRPAGQGYDAYDLWDLGEFDQKRTVATRWGTKPELLAAATAARAHGVDILIDAVLNHKLGGDRKEICLAVQVDAADRLRELGPPREIEAWTVFDFPGRGTQYSALRWTHEHFSGVDWDARAREGGVFRLADSWSRWVDRENGNYDYLLGVDIDHRHPEVRQDLFAWGEWVLQTTGASGFRLDAIKHMDRRFLREFLTRARGLEGKDKLFSVAEYWSSDIALITPYIKAFQGLTAFFDVPLHYAFHRASSEGAAFDLRTLFDGTVVAVRPDDAVTFVDNHDTQIGQTLESWVHSSFKLQAYALILLRGIGHPCVFYGDLYPNAECYDDAVAPALRALVRLRKTHAYGALREHVAGQNCIGFVRTGDVAHPNGGCVVLVSNADPSVGTHEVRMHVSSEWVKVGARYKPSLGESEAYVAVDDDGWGIFSCPANGLQVWVLSDEETQG